MVHMKDRRIAQAYRVRKQTNSEGVVDGMKDTIGKAISLGLGLALAGKEQVEKTFDELVKKGEIGKAESKALVEELLVKGEELRRQVETMARERVQAILGEREGKYATKADIARIEIRLDALERERQNPTEP